MSEKVEMVKVGVKLPDKTDRKLEIMKTVDNVSKQDKLAEIIEFYWSRHEKRYSAVAGMVFSQDSKGNS